MVTARQVSEAILYYPVPLKIYNVDIWVNQRRSQQKNPPAEPGPNLFTHKGKMPIVSGGFLHSNKWCSEHIS